MPFAQREQSAIDRYVTFLVNKQATARMFNRRIGLANALSTLLTNMPHNRESYQSAVEKVKAQYLTIVQQTSELLTHEFYAFWINDANSINLFKRYFCFDIETERSNLLLCESFGQLGPHSVNSYTSRPLILS